MHAPLSTVRGSWLALVCAAVGGVAQGQTAAPLLKADLVRLMSNNAFISAAEVAAVVRRNCLAFRPTERDWADIRSLGATQDIVESIAACGTRSPVDRSTTGAPTPPASTAPNATDLQVIVRRPLIVADAGGRVAVPIIAARGGLPRAGVELALRGTATIDGSAGRDLVATTDDTGFAVFDVPVGRRLAAYTLEVAMASGGPLPGRPRVQLVVRPGAPARVQAVPREVILEAGRDTIADVVVTVRDSVGHALVGETVTLVSEPEDMGLALSPTRTDSLGRARFAFVRGAVHRGGTLQVDVRGRPMAWVEVVLSAPLSESATGFQPLTAPRSITRPGLVELLVFEARTRAGMAAVGRAVTFRAVNAVVSPATAVTDTAGRVLLEATVGHRTGPALILATIDSLERHVTLQVEPGPAVELALEHDGRRVDGRWLVVRLDTTFTLLVRALDAHGNAAGLGTLAQMLRESRQQVGGRQRLFQLVGIEEMDGAIRLTFKTLRVGRTDLTITAGIGATVRVEVVEGT